MPFRYRSWIVLLVSTFLTAAGGVHAGPLSGIIPINPSSLPSGPFVGDSGIGTAEPTMVEIRGSGIVTGDPSSVWHKEISWNYSSDSISPGDRLCIREIIQLFGPPGTTGPRTILADWHETLVGSSVPLAWDLQGAGIAARAGISPIPINPMVMTSPDGQEIWFKFDPIALAPLGDPLGPPIEIEIQKYVIYTGTSVITSGGTTAALTFGIREQPSTPEPAGLSLACIGIMCMATAARLRQAGRRGGH